MKLVEKLDQGLDRVDLARPPPDQNVLLPRVIISCQKLKNVTDQIGDLVIGIPFLSMDDSAVVAALLHQGCTHLGNALAAAMYEPDGDSENVLEYLVSLLLRVWVTRLIYYIEHSKEEAIMISQLYPYERIESRFDTRIRMIRGKGKS